MRSIRITFCGGKYTHTCTHVSPIPHRKRIERGRCCAYETHTHTRIEHISNYLTFRSNACARAPNATAAAGVLLMLLLWLVITIPVPENCSRLVLRVRECVEDKTKSENRQTLIFTRCYHFVLFYQFCQMSVKEIGSEVVNKKNNTSGEHRQPSLRVGPTKWLTANIICNVEAHL